MVTNHGIDRFRYLNHALSQQTSTSAISIPSWLLYDGRCPWLHLTVSKTVFYVRFTLRPRWDEAGTPPPSPARPALSAPACSPTHRPPHSSGADSSTAAPTAPSHSATCRRSASPPGHIAPVTAATTCRPACWYPAACSCHPWSASAAPGQGRRQNDGPSRSSVHYPHPLPVGLLFRGFDTDITHGGVGGRLADSLGIEEVVLVAGDKGAYILRRSQLHLMAKHDEFAG